MLALRWHKCLPAIILPYFLALVDAGWVDV